MTVEVFDFNGERRDLAWLEQTYRTRFLDAGPGAKFKLARIDVTDGPAVFFVQILDTNGAPKVNQPVANHWPGVEDEEQAVDLQGGSKSVWQRHAIIQRTSGVGDTGFGFGGGSVIKEQGGPHTLWVVSPSLPSDGLARMGWLGGTNHRGPCRLTFREVEAGTPPEIPPGGDVMARLDAIHADLRRLMQHLGAG
jgi:hypothetical protein